MLVKKYKVTKKIVIEDNVFVGTHSAILGGSFIGRNSVVGAGTIIRNLKVPPINLVVGNHKN